MESKEEYKFRTKAGTCTITEDKIILNHSGIRGDIAKKLLGKITSPTLYIVIGGILLISGTYFILINKYFFGLSASFYGIYFFAGGLLSRNVSTKSTLLRSDIIDVKSFRPIPLITRGFFRLRFKDNEDIKNRFIILTGSLNGGYFEFKKARSIMKEAGFLNKE